MNDHVVVTLGQAFELANTIAQAANLAKAAGQDTVALQFKTPELRDAFKNLDTAFKALDAAETEFDQAAQESR